MKLYDSLYEHLSSTPLDMWIYELKKKIKLHLSHATHGEIESWKDSLEKLPDIQVSDPDFHHDVVKIGKKSDLDSQSISLVEIILRDFHPWRKGPYSAFDVFIDSEWRSDLKWNRLKDHVQPLKGKTILDVGCGNGYHCWRMYGEGADTVIGIDPYLKNVFQFYALKKFIHEKPVWVLPIGIEEMPHNMPYFDAVFSMGVFYHRRSPFDHLNELKSCLRDDGELILETLVINGKDGHVLVPRDRYAKMRNVWFIPSALTMESWLKRAGYKNIRTINISKTTKREQRSTAWMRFESLTDFLDPVNSAKTVEGYPAPRRAIFLAQL